MQHGHDSMPTPDGSTRSAGQPWILVGYHSKEGQTRKIAQHLAGRMRMTGATVDVRAIADEPPIPAYDAVVIGDPIYATKHTRRMRRYLRRHREELSATPTACFQVSLTSTNPDEDHTRTANALLDELTEQTGFAPTLRACFAGSLAYSHYGPLKKRLMRWISSHEGGDTDMSRDYEYTDWDAVDRFADDVIAMVNDRVEHTRGVRPA